MIYWTLIWTFLDGSEGCAVQQRVNVLLVKNIFIESVL